MLDEQSEKNENHQNPGWKHPYLIYILLTLVLFFLLLGIGYIALDQGWIPSRNGIKG